MIKRIVAFLIAVTVAVPLTVGARAMYESKTVRNVASGIVHTSSVRLDKSGWQNINIIEADLSNPYVKTKVLISEEMKNLTTVKKLATENNTSAAVNGDFFAWKSGENGKGSVMGAVMNDGKLLSSTSETDGMYTFAIDKFNKLICEHIKTNIVLTAPNGETLTIKHLNKYDSLAEPVIYTSAFSKVTDGSYDNILEVVIENGIVTEMRRDMEGVEIPENGYVIRHLPEFNPFLIDNLKVGDSVDIEFDANVELSEYQTMTGGGTMLVTQGQLAKITHNVSGTNPRTVIACDETRTKLYLITVDGRKGNATGYTLPQLAEYLLEIGMYDAMNLDGGGSTTMVIKSDEAQNVVNTPSDNGLRKVASGIGITSDAPKGKKLSGFEISAKDYNVFSGTSRSFEIINPVDEYGNPFSGKIPQITWKTDSGHGYFKDNVLYAQKPGKNVKIYASYGNYTATETINILDGLHSISVSPTHFPVGKFKSTDLIVTAKTADGREVMVESADVIINDINSYKKLVNVLDKSVSVTLSDILDDFDGNVYSASSYPSGVKVNIEKEQRIVKSGTGSIRLNYDFSGVESGKTGAAYMEFKKPERVSGIKKLGAWVYSPTILNQWIRAEFVNSDGDVLRETLTEKTDFAGWKYISFDVPEDAEKLTKLYVVQNSDKEKAKGYVVFDALSVFKQGFDSELITTNPSVHPSGDINFGVVAEMPEAKTLLSNLLAAKTASVLKNKDYIFSLASYDFKGTDEIKVSGYSSFKKNNSLFITLNNSDGYTSAAQWQKLFNDTDKSFDNLFLFLNENPDLIKDTNEKKMFGRMLENLSSKADVFVFYPDAHTCSYMSDGATFVGVGALNIASPKTAAMLIGKKQIPVVAISGNDVKLKFVNMY